MVVLCPLPDHARHCARIHDPAETLIPAWASLAALRIIRSGRPLPSHIVARRLGRLKRLWGASPALERMSRQLGKLLRRPVVLLDQNQSIVHAAKPLWVEESLSNALKGGAVPSMGDSSAAPDLLCLWKS